MKDGTVRKVNFCFNSERIWTEDCSLETNTELFRIGEAEIEKARLGDPGRTDIKTRKLLQDVFHQLVVILKSLYSTSGRLKTVKVKFSVSPNLSTAVCVWKDVYLQFSDVVK